MWLDIHTDVLTDHAGCCGLGINKMPWSWHGVHVDLQWFHNPDIPTKSETRRISIWVVDALRMNGSKHLTGKQLKEVVWYAEEVIRKSNGEALAGEFWEMVEAEE